MRTAGFYDISATLNPMGAKNGQTVYDIVAESWRRTVTRFGGHESLAVNIPKDYSEEEDVEAGDDVVIRPAEDRENVLELHFDR